MTTLAGRRAAKQALTRALLSGGEPLFHALGRRPRHPRAPRKILLIKYPPGLGDTLVGTPAIHALRETYPEAEIWALVGSAARLVLADNPDLDGIIPWDDEWIDAFLKKGRRRGWGERARLVWRLYRQRFDLAVDLFGSSPTRYLMYLAGIPERVGFSEPYRGTERLLTRGVRDVRWVEREREITRSKIELNLDVVRLVGADTAERQMRLPVPAAARRAIAKRLTGAGLAPARRLAALHPGSCFPSRRWPPERFAAVGDHLAERHGLAIVVTGSPDERDLAGAVAGAMRQPALVLAGETGLAELGALYARCRLVICNDTGAMHVAAAMGAPLVAITGPTFPIFAPRGPHDQVVREEAPCSPCQLIECDKGAEWCLGKIAVARVLAAVDRELAPEAVPSATR